MLEGEAAALTAQLRTDKDIERLTSAIESFRSAVNEQDWASRVSATADFYEVIIECCGNPIMGDVLHGLLSRINFLRTKTMASPGRAAHSLTELESIYKAVVKGDQNAARKAAISHVQSAAVEARKVYEIAVGKQK